MARTAGSGIVPTGNGRAAATVNLDGHGPLDRVTASLRQRERTGNAAFLQRFGTAHAVVLRWSVPGRSCRIFVVATALAHVHLMKDVQNNTLKLCRKSSQFAPTFSTKEHKSLLCGCLISNFRILKASNSCLMKFS